MRSLLIFMLLTGAIPAAFIPASPQTAQTTDAREPFGVELPEINTGLIEAAKTTDVFIPPGKQITRLKLWLLNPYADRVSYSGFKASLNGKSLATVARPLSGAHGKFLDVDLRVNPDLRLASGKNVIELTARESESGRAYRCSFVLLSGAAAKLVGGAVAAEIRCEIILSPEDPSLPISDRQAPSLTLIEPKAAITATAPGALSVRVSGEASDDSGVIVAVTVNGRLIAASPKPPSRKSNKKDKTPPPDPATIKLPFDQTVTIEASQRAALIEARDGADNRALCIAPILRETAASTPAFGGRKFAVLAGVSWYRFNEGGLNNLQFADADALAMRAWLRTAGGGDFKDEDIECLTNQNATLAAVEAAVNRFLTKAGENDLIYLFLAGHGAPDPYDRRSLYFLLHDSKVTDLPRTAFPMKKLGEFLDRQSKMVRLIAFFDTCHSAGVKAQTPSATTPANTTTRDGRGIGSKNNDPKKSDAPAPPPKPQNPMTRTTSVSGFDFYNADLFKQKGWTVITSSGMNELSQEGAQWGGGHGVFTWALLEGLRGAADENRDCVVSAGEIFKYVTERVRRETANQQNPQSLPGANTALVIAATPGGPNCKR